VDGLDRDEDLNGELLKSMPGDMFSPRKLCEEKDGDGMFATEICGNNALSAPASESVSAVTCAISIEQWEKWGSGHYLNCHDRRVLLAARNV
jgi:hypothetical protein